MIGLLTLYLVGAVLALTGYGLHVIFSHGVFVWASVALLPFLITVAFVVGLVAFVVLVCRLFVRERAYKKVDLS